MLVLPRSARGVMAQEGGWDRTRGDCSREVRPQALIGVLAGLLTGALRRLGQMVTGWCTWQVFSLVSGSDRVWFQGSTDQPEPHARHFLAPDAAPSDRLAVLRIRRSRSGRRTRHRRADGLVLRAQHRRRGRLRPPLAGRPEPRRYLYHRLGHGAAGGHPLRRLPVPGHLDRRQRSRPRTRHTFRALVVHGDRDRRVATPARGDRERPRVAVCNRHPTRTERPTP